jgi:arylsulfatase A-like enzyme
VHGWEQSFAAVKRSYLATLINGQWHFEGAKADSLDKYAQPYDAAYLDKLRPFENGYDVDILLNTPKHLTDALADAAIDFMRIHITNNQPFFAFIAFHAVHRPYVPRIDIESKYKAIPSADLRHDNFRFAAFVETLDQAVGRITAFLDNPDSDSRTNDSVANNTLVIFLSDNGGSDRDQSPLRERKSTLWEGGIRVPMIARMPGWITPMTSTNESVHVIDLYPTLVELAGGSAPNLPIPDDPTYVLDGESLVRLLDGTQSHLVRNAVYWHFPGYFDGHIPQPLSVIIKRVGNLHYKLHYFYETEHFELYDLDNDLSEAINLLADTPTCSDLQVASGMAEDLRNWLLDTGADFPLIRATGQPVPPPPTIAIPMSCDHHPASD